MTFSDVLITEGIRFFKDSKKLLKLALKIESKYLKAKDEDTKSNLKQVIEKINFAASAFENLENRYPKDKKNVRKEYNDLRKNYMELFDFIRKQNIKKALVSVGIFAAVSAAILLSIDKLDKFLIDNNIMMVHDKNGFPGISTTYTNAGLRKMVAEICKKENISFKLVSTLIDKESEWNPNGINHNKNGTTDYGLMQLNNSNKYMFEKYFWDRKEKFDIKNPEHNATVGIKFFKSLLKQYHNDVKKALTAYNAGAAAVTYDNPPESTIHYRSSIIKKFQS